MSSGSRSRRDPVLKSSDGGMVSGADVVDLDVGQ
jgi:hypothetical protein